MNFNNFEEYEDPNLYDKENDGYLPEIPLLEKWAQKVKGTIIDIACGTGRVTIPLAQKGFQLLGIDVHQGMLNEAKRKSSKQQLPTQWRRQDCTNLHLGVKSELIYCVGNSFQHFLTNEDQDGLLSSVNKHLEVEGYFIFGTRFPSREELLQESTEEYWRSYIDRDSNLKVDMYTVMTYDSIQQIQHYTTIRKYKNEAGQIVDEKRTNIRLRYVYPKEMERLMRKHGFEIVELYGDWKESPLTNDSYEMIYICQKRG